MSDAIFCPNCGERISARARFCSRAAPARRVLSRSSPSRRRTRPRRRAAGEPLTERRRAGRSAGRRAAGAARAARDRRRGDRGRRRRPAIVLAAGLLIALSRRTRRSSASSARTPASITEAFRQAVGTLLTAMVDPGLLIAGSRRIHPLLLLAIPLTALALTTRWQLHRTEGAPPLVRLGWAMLVAVPFALLMLVFAVIGGDSERHADLAVGRQRVRARPAVGRRRRADRRGAKLSLPAPSERPRPDGLTAATRDAAPAGGGPASPARRSGSSAGSSRSAPTPTTSASDRSAPTALIEEAAFAGRARRAHDRARRRRALPRRRATARSGCRSRSRTPTTCPGRDGAFRIFSYDDELPAYVAAARAVLLMALLALGALYAGFAAARAVRAGSLVTAAALGRDHRPGLGDRDGRRSSSLAGGLLPRRRRRRLGVRHLPARRRAARRRGRRAGRQRSGGSDASS